MGESAASRAPAARWGRVWAVATLIAISVLGGWEHLVRQAGFEPSLQDDDGTWARAYRRVQDDSIVLIGASRIQAGIDTTRIGAIRPGKRVVQLAAAGGDSPLPVLEALAADEDFHGTVVVDMIPRVIFDDKRSRERKPLRRLAHAKEAAQSPAARSEAYLSQLVQSTFVFRDPRVGPKRAKDMLHKGLPAPKAVTILPDRSCRMDFDRIRAKKKMRRNAKIIAKEGRPAKGAAKREAIARVDAAVSAISKRGGEVIFVRLPVSKAIARTEEERYPRSEYWDAFIAEIDAVHVHYADHPSLAKFETPDGSHLDYRDAPAFTSALVVVLEPALAERGARLDPDHPRR